MQFELVMTAQELWQQAPCPHYAQPGERSEVGIDNDRLHDLARSLWQTQFEQLDWPGALRRLHAQQMDAGFIQDDLSRVNYFQCYNDRRDARFIGMLNPMRAERTAGAGRRTPPRGAQTADAPDPSCYLCLDNVRWQQRGVQIPFQMRVNQHPYAALCNPFPFAPLHTTIVSAAHEPQVWQAPQERENKARRIAADVYALAQKLPGFVVFYNGAGAGATIAKHLHFHVFEAPKAQQPFPLQLAAQAAARAAEPLAPAVLDIGIQDALYPLGVFRLSGGQEEVVENAIALCANWDRLLGEDATANIIALTEAGQTVLYFVPRNRHYTQSPGMAGIAGGLEALGVFVFSTPAEAQAIAEQKVTFDYMRRILEAVKPPYGLERLRDAVTGAVARQ